jgi:hypothetical protein
VTLRDARTFKVQRSVAIVDPGAATVYWPSATHLLTTSREPSPDQTHPIVTNSYDLATGERNGHHSGVLEDAERAGARVRIVRRVEGTLLVVELDEQNGIVKRTPVQLPAPYTDAADVRIERGLLLVSEGARHALVPVGGTARAVTLPAGSYDWAGPRLVAGAGRLARIDRRRLRVTSIVRTGLRGPVLVAGRRLYGLLGGCDKPSGVAIASARTGRRVAKRTGPWTLGTLGAGYLLCR